MTNLNSLSDFSYRGIKLARDILTAWADHGLPADFKNDQVKLEFNSNSGYVFLINSAGEIATLQNDRLERFYELPCLGTESTLQELIDLFREGQITDHEDLVYLQEICSRNNYDLCILEEYDDEYANS